MHSVWGICPSLRSIKPISSHCTGARAHKHVHQHSGAHVQRHTLTQNNVCANSKTKICHLEIQGANVPLKIQAVTFIRRPQPKPSFFQTKGHVCGRADISTSLSLTHSLQRQRLCLVTHGDSVRSSTAWCEPVLP